VLTNPIHEQIEYDILTIGKSLDLSLDIELYVYNNHQGNHELYVTEVAYETVSFHKDRSTTSEHYTK
jgi:hypothetical protein